MEAATNALLAKSFSSARFTLLKNLANSNPLRVLSYEPASSWKKDLFAYNRYQITIIYREKFSELSLSEILKTQTIDAVYLSSIHSETLVVENHHSIISQSHSFKIPVVFDNTAGAFGSVYQPLAYEADYVITDTAESSFAKSGIGAYIAEGFPQASLRNCLAAITQHTPVQDLKKKRILLKKQPFLLPKDKNAFANQLHREVHKNKTFAKNAFTLAKWLNQSELVMEVNYPGLKTSESFLNAENNLRGGYGAVFKFKLWDEGLSFNLLRSFFAACNPSGLIVTADDKRKEFKVKVVTESIDTNFTTFQSVFTMLGKELDYRSFLNKQLQLKEALGELLKA